MEDENKIRLRKLLRELFQFENEDLDFGIYRIMNYKKEQIERFIEKDLVEEIGKQLDLLAEEEKEASLREFNKLEKRIIEAFGDDAFKGGELKEQFKSTPLGKQYDAMIQELEKIKVSEDLERGVYNHIYSFFSRYYDSGDFISKRRYGKKTKYVVPHNGEETLLYWANRDQYYVKSSEHFQKFSFKDGALKVNFRVIMVEEEAGNSKAGEKKFFVTSQDRLWDYNKDNDQLTIYFEFRSLKENEKQKFRKGVRQEDLNKRNLEVITKKLRTRKEFSHIFEKERDKTILENQLNKYTKRNTMDYFIHKDLKAFLEQELDFYIKNEVLNLEDMEKFDKEKLSFYLLEAQTIRNISLKIADFLAQIENFQRKIWEKRKFVIKTEYVITLDKIKKHSGEEFLESILDEVLKNERQLNEWKELFGIEVKNKIGLIEKHAIIGNDWKKLPIDTKYFDEKFRWELLEKLSEKHNLEDIVDGIIIKSENWQALNLVLPKFREKIRLVYIDPPFNTGSDEFLYKDNYQHSSWLAMMHDGLEKAKDLLTNDGSIYVHIDCNENSRLKLLLNAIFGSENFKSEIVWKRLTYKQTQVKGYGVIHDEILYYTKSDNYIWNDVRIKYDENRLKKYFRWIETPDGKNIRLSRKQLEGKEPIPDGRRFALNPLLNINPDRPHLRYEFLGFTKTWKYTKEKMMDYYQKGIVFQPSPGSVPQRKQYLDESKGMKINDLWLDISGVMGGSEEYLQFDTQKPERLLKRMILVSSNPRDYVLDYFLGSGTTTAVAHKLGRKYIGVEMAEYFDTLIIPRMKKVLFGKQMGISKEVNWQGGGFFKYHIVEQYEDALENIEFEQKKLVEFEDYFVKYMLDFETKKSKTFLNIDEMEDPFDYKLRIIENCEPKTVKVDLVETFNYLIGLKVSTFKVLNDNRRKYVFVFGEVNGRKTLIAWRPMKDIDFENDKKIISAVIAEFNPEEIYVNGDCVVKGFKQIENEFKTLLFWR